MKYKKVAAILLSSILMLSLISPAYAKASTVTNPEIGTDFLITPMWTNTECITLNLSFENGVAYLYCRILGALGTTRIDADLRLEYKTPSGWFIVNTWHRYSSGNLLTFYGTAMAYEGTQYRFIVTSYVVRNGVCETVTQSIERTY